MAKASDPGSVNGSEGVPVKVTSTVTEAVGEGPPAPTGAGLAMRMGTEMVAATLIGLGMGYLLDKWLETHPWMTLLFFLFGSVAGFRNMYRLINPVPGRPGF